VEKIEERKVERGEEARRNEAKLGGMNRKGWEGEMRGGNKRKRIE
jgi:hypothetical protein